jgi:hypothetical protein
MLGFGIAFIGIYMLFILTMLVFTAWVWWRIFAKTGHGGWMGILMLVPLANLIVFIMLAFGEWPIERELEAWRAQARGGGPTNG